MVLKPILSRISMNHHTHRPPCHVDPAHRHSKRAFWSANVKKVRDHMCNLTTRTSENRQCNNANNIVRDIYMQWRCSRFYWPFYEQHEQTHYSGIPTHNNIIHRSMSSWSGSRKKIIRFCPSIYTRRWHIHCSAICVACGGPKKGKPVKCEIKCLRLGCQMSLRRASNVICASQLQPSIVQTIIRRLLINRIIRKHWACGQTLSPLVTKMLDFPPDQFDAVSRMPNTPL